MYWRQLRGKDGAYEHADAADEHGEGEGAPVFVPWQAVGAVPAPRVPVVRAHAIDEDKEHDRKKGEGDELEDEAGEEYLRASCRQHICSKKGWRTYVCANISYCAVALTGCGSTPSICLIDRG